MDWKTTEELYAELLEMKAKARDALSEASRYEHISEEAKMLSERHYEDERWMSAEVRELEKELAKRVAKAH